MFYNVWIEFNLNKKKMYSFYDTIEECQKEIKEIEKLNRVSTPTTFHRYLLASCMDRSLWPVKCMTADCDGTWNLPGVGMQKCYCSRS